MVSGIYKYTYQFPPDHQVLHFAKKLECAAKIILLTRATGTYGIDCSRFM
jgi:hypothetical protein